MRFVAAMILLLGCTEEIGGASVIPSEDCPTAKAYRLYRDDWFVCSAFPVQHKWVTSAHCLRDGSTYIIGGSEVTFVAHDDEQDWAIGEASFAPPGYLPGTPSVGPTQIWGFPGARETLSYGDIVDIQQHWVQTDILGFPGQSGGVMIQNGCYAVGVTSVLVNGVDVAGPMLPEQLR